MRTQNPSIPKTQFDTLVVDRLFAPDFAQPQIKDPEYYKNRSNIQIQNAVQAIFDASNQHDFTTAVAQANAFIDAAMDYEFIDISEKAKWLDDIANAVRVQTIEE